MPHVDGIDHRREVVGRLPSPAGLRERVPASVPAGQFVLRARREVADVIAGNDDRLIAVVGPCSVHDHSAGIEYAQRLAALAAEVRDTLVLVMRVYVEKPRTRLGWTGLVERPAARRVTRRRGGAHPVAPPHVRRAGPRPAGRERVPRSARRAVPRGSRGVGIRRREDRPQPAPPPSGQRAQHADRDQEPRRAAARRSPSTRSSSGSRGHVIPGIDDHGFIALFKSAGNPDCHLVLRGGLAGRNCSPLDVARTVHLLKSADLPACVVIDASHGNSNKDPDRQCAVVADLAERIAGGERGIAGVMMESFLAGGRQDLSSTDPDRLVFGQSITDACASWTETVDMIEALAGGRRRPPRGWTCRPRLSEPQSSQGGESRDHPDPLGTPAGPRRRSRTTPGLHRRSLQRPSPARTLPRGAVAAIAALLRRYTGRDRGLGRVARSSRVARGRRALHVGAEARWPIAWPRSPMGPPCRLAGSRSTRW